MILLFLIKLIFHFRISRNLSFILKKIIIKLIINYYSLLKKLVFKNILDLKKIFCFYFIIISLSLLNEKLYIFIFFYFFIEF